MAQHMSIALTSIPDQVQHLVNRGMVVDDRGVAERSLTHIGFERLSSYWTPLESTRQGRHGAQFRDRTTFMAVLGRYLFDQRLRSHMLDALSYIEISIRTDWARQLAYGHGEQAHLDATLFNKHHADNLKELASSYKRFTKDKGADISKVTILDVIHAMSFGQLSKWYANLSKRAIRQAIARRYGMSASILLPALQQLTEVRNICAHHDRLWDVKLNSSLKIPNTLGSDPDTPKAFNEQSLDKVYNAIVITTHLMEVITPNGNWIKRFLELCPAEPNRPVPKSNMGFPENWTDHAIWQRHLEGKE